MHPLDPRLRRSTSLRPPEPPPPPPSNPSARIQVGVSHDSHRIRSQKIIDSSSSGRQIRWTGPSGNNINVWFVNSGVHHSDIECEGDDRPPHLAAASTKSVLRTKHSCPPTASYHTFRQFAAAAAALKEKSSAYEMQEMSVWLPTEAPRNNGNTCPFQHTGIEMMIRNGCPRGTLDVDDGDHYESIYEVIREPDEDDYSEFDEIEEEYDEVRRKINGGSALIGPGLTTKLAEAAGKRMKKLRRSWSIKKSDISRSLSRIRKCSTPTVRSFHLGTPPMMSTGLRKKASFISGAINPRRKPTENSGIDAKSVIRHHGGPVLGGSSKDETTFYITLTIERDDDDDDEDIMMANKSESYGASYSSSSITDRSHVISSRDSNAEGSLSSNDESSLSTGLNYDSGLDRSLSSLLPKDTQVKARQKTSSRGGNYVVIRPTEAPPAPPPKFPTKSPLATKPREENDSEEEEVPPPLPLSSPPPMTSFSYHPLELTSTATPFMVDDYDDDDDDESPVTSDIGSSFSSYGAATGLDVSFVDSAAEETYMSSLFHTEPLYQFYDTTNHIGVSLSGGKRAKDFIINNDNNNSTDMYESVENQEEENEPANRTKRLLNKDDDEQTSNPIILPPSPPTRKRRKEKPSTAAESLVSNSVRPSAMDLVTSFTCPGGRRTMWAELPEVSGILSNLSSDRKKLQEAMFEVVTSEASYLKSLNVLIRQFVQSPIFIGDQSKNGVISKRDYRILFSDILAVRHCSEKFLEDLEKRWQSSVLLSGICEVVRDHAKMNFQVYVKYCSNQVYQDRITKKLMSKNTKFVEALRQLETSPICQSLTMHSFLMLPMQRITRLPLLVDAIFNRLNTNSSEYGPCKEALDTLNKLVKECNESARNMERMEEMLILSQQLDFREVKAVPLISASRWLVKRGETTRIWWKENSEAKLTFGRRINRQNLVLFLFTDLLIITKKKSEEHYLVVDYCSRNFVQLQEVENTDGGSLKYVGQQAHHLVWLTLLQSNENRTVEWLLAFQTECEKKAWIGSVSPVHGGRDRGGGGEKIYEEWDCPRVEAVQDFVKTSSSEQISLQKGQSANVLKKLNDSGDSSQMVLGNETLLEHGEIKL